MKVKDLKKILAGMDENKVILVSSDEELNTIYKTIKVGIEAGDGRYVIYGLTGTEI